MATYVEPKYKPCGAFAGSTDGPLYYNFWNCTDDEFGQCPPRPEQILLGADQWTCDDVAPGCLSCTGTSPGGGFTLITPPDAVCINTDLYPSGTIPCGVWVEGEERQNPVGFYVSIHPDFILSDAGGTNYAGDSNASALWAQCGALGAGSGLTGWDLDPAHPECFCNGPPFRCSYFCTDFPEPACTGEWNAVGFDNGCASYCPFCAGFTVLDPASGLCKLGVYDGHCPPGTHPDPACGACVSDLPPHRCWVWKDCRWQPPASRCDYPLIFDPISCSCFCPSRACPPNSYPDPATCACNTCPFGECWCATEQRCITCEDPPCKAARNCVWDPLVCDWNCLPMPPGSSGCAVGEVYDLASCTCIPECPPNQCWCNGTSSCMACTPPDCWRELHCVWDVDACDWACQPPPCVPPATWTGPPLCKCVGGEKGPWNFHTILAHYHAASDDKGILYERSEGPVPPFAASVQITADPAHTQPRMVHDWRGRWLLLYTDNSSGTPRVVEIVSHDDGDTWSHPRTVFMSAKHPMPAGPLPYSGCVLYAAYDGGNILIERSYPGDLSPSASFTAQDDAGSPLVVDDASFGLSQAPDGPGRWVLHALQGGARKHLISTDDGESWEVVA